MGNRGVLSPKHALAYGRPSDKNLHITAKAVEERSRFDNQRLCPNISGNVCGAAEHKFIGVDFALDRSIDFCYRDIDHCLTQLCPDTNGEGAVLRIDLAGKVSINAERRFKGHLAGKLRNVADEAEPVVSGDIYSLDTFFSSRNCLSTHGFLFLFS